LKRIRKRRKKVYSISAPSKRGGGALKEGRKSTIQGNGGEGFKLYAGGKRKVRT